MEQPLLDSDPVQESSRTLASQERSSGIAHSHSTGDLLENGSGLLQRASEISASDRENHSNVNHGTVEIKDNSDSRMLLISFVCMIFVGLGNKLFQVFQSIPMHNYPFFLSVLSTFIYIPTSFTYIWLFPSHISDEERTIPKRTFAVMGFLDALSGIMLTIAINFVIKRTLVILLQQTAIPISMLISRVSLGTKYNVFQYSGAFVVIFGLLVVLAPSGDSQDSEDGYNAKSELLWMTLLVLSNVPTCLSSVYKEKALGELDINVVYLNGWVALYQFVVTLPLMVPSAPMSHLDIQDIPENLKNGMLCYFGTNSIIDTRGANASLEDVWLQDEKTFCYDIQSGRTPVCDNCGMAPLYVSIYMVFNFAYNICLVCILKYGNSNILWLSMTFMVPLCNFVFYIPSVPGHVQPKLGDLIGLLTICLGLFLYRFAESLSEQCSRRYRYSRLLMESPRTLFHNREKEAVASRRIANHITLSNVNNVEIMQTVVQATASRIQIKLRRTPVQIRNAYLHRLGLNIRDSPTHR